jgi:sulfite exporter TauE/SafE
MVTCSNERKGTTVIAIFSGMIAGAVHVFAGPDHLAAVAPLTVEHRKKAWLMGFNWGIGHSAGVLMVGALALLLREIIPLDLVSNWAERLVGIVLIAIGLWGMRRALRHRLHNHEHHHDGVSHLHLHLHSAGETASPQEKSHHHTHTAMAIGGLHGLAGSSHFLGVLPALAFPTNAQAGAYLLAYAAGTVLAMVAFSWAVGWLAKGFAFSNVAAYRMLLMICSLAALGIGGYWLVA